MAEKRVTIEGMTNFATYVRGENGRLKEIDKCLAGGVVDEEVDMVFKGIPEIIDIPWVSFNDTITLECFARDNEGTLRKSYTEDKYGRSIDRIVPRENSSYILVTRIETENFDRTLKILFIK